MRKLLFPALLATLLAAPAAQAALVTYNFAWTGTDGYTMTGNFSFDSASAADGAIRDGEVVSLFFEGFLNGTPIGSNAIAPTQADFNFNFNAWAGQFFLGGDTADDRQDWNFEGLGLGFAAGITGSALSSGGINMLLGVIENPPPLTATLAVSIPEPGSLALVALSLGALGLARRRRAG